VGPSQSISVKTPGGLARDNVTDMLLHELIGVRYFFFKKFQSFDG
jgi:hypothetical protein